MYILKNALRNITRSKGRNIIIGIIVAVISISSCIALSINNAAAKAEEKGLDALNITGQISVDRQKLMEKAQEDGTDMREAMQSHSEPTLEELQKYAGSSYVKNFYYKMTSSINASGELNPVDTSSDTSSDEDTNASTENKDSKMPSDKVPKGMGTQGDFTIIGYSSEDAMTDFVDGTSKITDGKVFDTNAEDKNCIISKELASFNSLKVGDKITFANPNVDTETYEFTIVGIYENTSTTSSSSNMRFSTSMDPANQIYTGYNALKAVTDSSEKNATTETDAETGNVSTTALRSQSSGTYVFSDAANYEAFKTGVKSMGLSEYYTVSSNDVSSYEQSLVPLKNLSSFAKYFLIVVLGIGGIILAAFNIFNIRERKFEVGVLTAIGMKKSKVAMQFITEIFTVTLLAIIIGTAIGAAVSVPTADKLLQSQVASQQAQVQEQSQNFGKNMGSGQDNQKAQVSGNGNRISGFKDNTVDYISNIDAAIDLNVVGQILGIGIILTIISSLAGVIFILRYEPLKILSDRS